MSEDTKVDSFTVFVKEVEPRLRHALVAVFGVEAARDATAEALAYGWEHWDEVRSMSNPAGYLYRVGYDRGRAVLGRRRPVLPPVPVERAPWVEPGLNDAVMALPEKQRVVVFLLHGYDWTMSEVAEVLGISKASVQTHARRGMSRLRRKLGVTV